MKAIHSRNPEESSKPKKVIVMFKRKIISECHGNTVLLDSFRAICFYSQFICCFWFWLGFGLNFHRKKFFFHLLFKNFF